jgi:pimeloyl-ACP methyl ester carboxylesterase
VQIWEYQQTEDEARSLDMAVELLHDFLTWRDRPLHLINHSTSGLVGLMYARRYPHKVSSLGLLAVGWLYAINLQAHYYTHLSVAKTRLISVIPRKFGSPASTVLAQFPQFIPPILVCRILRDGV